MNRRQKKYAEGIQSQMDKAKGIFIENPNEVSEMLGLQMYEFEILTGDDAYCADEEILIDFQGKEMRIYIDEDGKLAVYTD